MILERNCKKEEKKNRRAGCEIKKGKRMMTCNTRRI